MKTYAVTCLLEKYLTLTIKAENEQEAESIVTERLFGIDDAFFEVNPIQVINVSPSNIQMLKQEQTDENS